MVPFTIAKGTMHFAQNIFIRIHTDSAITGVGECSAFPMITGETQATCFEMAKDFASLWKNRDALDLDQRMSELHAFTAYNNTAKSAFDMALYDIAAQHSKLPLYKFLGGDKNKTIATDYTVSIGEPEKMAKDAIKIRDEGYSAIKVKLGKDGKKDVERMRAVRQAVGKDIPLRIDANQGWNVEEAIQTLNALSAFDIQHCEEPIPRWNFMKLPEIKKASPIPIMADESCGDEHDAERLISIKACDYMNIKLGKSGGIFKALKIVKLAADAGIHLQVGAFVESRLAMTAFAHFSLCHPLIEHYDFDTALMFSEDPVTGGIIYSKDGVITVPDSPGLGASIGEKMSSKWCS